MSTLATLKAARKLIENPENWTVEAFARTSDGNVIGFNCDNARCFCAAGAIRRVIDGSLSAACKELFFNNNYASPTNALIAFNDTHSHGEVLQLFDAAIARLEATPDGSHKERKSA